MAAPADSITEIHSFHVNVGNGEASIHLGVSQPGGKPNIHKAVLCDGGKPGSIDQIKRTFSYIEKNYSLFGTDANLKFDAVVITKWAVDHSAGFLKLVIDDLKPQASNPKCSFFRYDSNGAPLTTLYSPYWTPVATSSFTTFAKFAPPANISIQPPKQSNSNGAQNASSTANSPRIVDFVQAGKTWSSICLLAAGSAELMGRDIFSQGNTKISGQASGFSSTSTGFFCVAADGQHFNASDGSIKTADPLGPKGSPSISLLAVVGGAPQHYLAGDSDTRVDAAVAAWIKSVFPQAKSVPILKLSNHGNISTISTDILDDLQPSHFICSTGPSLSNLHPRWEVLVLLRAFMISKSLAAEKAATAGATTTPSTPKIKPFFHPTNYPVYLANEDFLVDFRGFLDDTNDTTAQKALTAAGALQAAIASYDALSLSIIENALTQVKAASATTMADELQKARQWIAGWLRSIVPAISYTKPEHYPILQSMVGPKTPVTAQTQLLFIKVMVSADETTVDYVNGAWKVVGSSEDDATADSASSNQQSGFMNQNFTIGETARGSPWTQVITTAPSSTDINLPDSTANTVKASKLRTNWDDYDDETRRDDFVPWGIAIEANPNEAIASLDGLPYSVLSSASVSTNLADAYYFASSVYPDAKAPTTNFRNLTADSYPDLGTFVAGFEPGFLAFKGIDVNAQAQKAPLQDSVPGLGNLWAHLMSAPNIVARINFGFDAGDGTNLPKMNKLFVESDLFGAKSTLFFDSDNVVSNNATDPRQFDSSLNGSYSGFCVSGTGVVLVGMDHNSLSANWSVSFKDIMEKFQIRDNSTISDGKGGSTSFLKAALGDIDMILQPPAAGVYPQNAMWMFSGDPYRYTSHLTFWLGDPTKNATQILNANVIQIIAQKAQTWLGISTGVAEGWLEQITGLVDKANQHFSVEATMTCTYQLVALPEKDPSTNSFFAYAISIESSLRLNLNVQIDGHTLPFAIDVGNKGDLQFSISPDGISVDLQHFYNAVAGFLDTSSNTIGNAPVSDFPNGSSDEPPSTPAKTDSIALQNAWIARADGVTTFGVNLTANFNPTGNIDMTLGFNYSSAGIYQGGLILPKTDGQLTQQMLPDYDPLRTLPSSTTPLTLSELIGNGVPAGLPDNITEFSIIYDGNGKSLTIAAAIESVILDKAQTPNVPAFDFSTLSLNITKSWGGDGVTWGMECDATIILNAANDANGNPLYDPATLTASVAKESSMWLTKAHIENFHLGVLISHFPQGYQNAASDFLGNILVSSLDVLYTHDAGGQASSFLMSGAISLGLLELDLVYQYTSSAVTAGKSAADITAATQPDVIAPKDVKSLPSGMTSDWSFDAALGSASGQSSTIGQILDSIDDGLSQHIPDFVCNTTIQPTSPDGTAPVYFGLAAVPPSDPAKPAPQQLMCTINVQIGDVGFTFVQLTDKVEDTTGKMPTSKSNIPAPKSPRGQNAQPKRILRFTLSKIPLIDDIPVVNQLPQPFDDLEYVFVSYPGASGPGADPSIPVTDATGENDTSNNPTSLGFTAEELGWVNTQLDSKNVPTFKVMDNGSDKTAGQPTSSEVDPGAAKTKVILAAGQHFIVSHDGKAVVDYVFGSAKKPTPNPDTSIQNVKVAAHAQKKEADTNDSALSPSGTAAPPKKGAVGIHLGPLTIENVGLKFDVDANILWILMDGSLLLGPIEFGLLGFGIGLRIGGPNGIHDLTEPSILLLATGSYFAWQLHGFEVGFSKDPLSLAGVFVHSDTPDAEVFGGGIAVGYKQYSFLAVGEYREQKNPAYKSFFLYAKVDGLMITFEFATVTGVRLGFGYNSLVDQPDINQLSEFPFVDGSPSSSTASVDTLYAMYQTMTSFVHPSEGKYWACAGLKANVAGVVDITAVMMFAFESGGVDVSIFGDAIAAEPPGLSASQALIYIQIDFAIELAFIEGFLRVAGQINPASHALMPGSNLSGGFALCYWFNPNVHSGDWVFSVGGYHKSFQIPDHYPQPIARIPIGSRLGAVTLSGEFYFAICPKAVMAGGHLHFQYDLGPISAWADFWMDMLIMYEPFHYLIEVGMSVGISFNINFLFVHIHIGTSIDADLQIQGPKFGGSMYVDFSMWGFTVYFGDSGSTPTALKWYDDAETGRKGFLSIVQTPGPPINPPDSADNTTLTKLHITLADGSLPSPKGPQSAAANSQATTANDPSGIGHTDALTIWRVRAGDFAFQIGCDVAIRTFEVNEDDHINSQGLNEATGDFFDPQTDIKDQDTLLKTQGITIMPYTPVTQDPFAKPMQLTQMQTDSSGNTKTVPIPLTVSHLVVAIDSDDSSIEAENLANEPTNWIVTPVIKNMPLGLWGPYSTSGDPMISGNNIGPSLDSSPSTVALCMGINIHAPKPILSDDRIPKFKVEECCFADVNGESDLDPVLHATPDPQTDLLPSSVKYYIPTDGVTPPAGKITAQDAWNNTASTWGIVAIAEASKVQILMDECAAFLGWDQPTAQQLVDFGSEQVNQTVPLTAKQWQAVKPWQIEAVVPSRMLDNGFGDGEYYLALPMVTVGTDIGSEFPVPAPSAPVTARRKV